MPAQKLETWRPSECPVHGSVHAIWLDGHYGRWSAYHERVRYTCVRFDEAGKRHTHRFTLPVASRLPTEHALSDAPDVDACDQARPRQGSPVAEDSTFSIPEIAGLLIAVGTGKPLRDCAHDLRREARRRHCAPNRGRARTRLEHKPCELAEAPIGELAARPNRRAEATAPAAAPAAEPRQAAATAAGPRAYAPYNYSSPKRIRRVDASRSASIAMDYVDQYGPVVLRDVAPDRWPAYVALGSVPLPRRHRPGATAGEESECLACGPDRGEIMVAADCELPHREYPFHARLGGGTDKESWIEFFRSLAGRPSWIAARRHQGLAEAVSELWPDTVLYASEDQLRDELRLAARRDLIPESQPERGPLYDEIRAAFRDADHWRAMIVSADALAPARASELRAWIEDNDTFVVGQLARKRQYRHAPFTNAAVRPALEKIGSQLLPYAAALRNLWRVNLRLALMSAHWSDLDREAEYRAALDRHFAIARLERAGRPGPGAGKARGSRPDWASGRDFGGARSIDDFLAAAAQRRRLAHRLNHSGLLVPFEAAEPEDLAAVRSTAGLSRRPGISWVHPEEPGIQSGLLHDATRAPEPLLHDATRAASPHAHRPARVPEVGAIPDAARPSEPN